MVCEFPLSQTLTSSIYGLSRELQEQLDATLLTLLNVTGDMANLQLFDPHKRSLKIVSQQGFKTEFMAFFGEVRDQPSACGAALRRGEQVAVESVATDPIFRGTESRKVMLNADAWAVQSTPLTGSRGQCLGVVSTHYSKPRKFSRREMLFIREVAAEASRYIERDVDWPTGARLTLLPEYSLFWSAGKVVSFVESIYGLRNSIRQLKNMSSQERGTFILFAGTNVVASGTNGWIEMRDGDGGRI